MARIPNETLITEDRPAFEEAGSAAPDLLTQPSALPALPTVDGQPLRFASAPSEMTPDAAVVPPAFAPKKSARFHRNLLTHCFGTAMLMLLLTCALSCIARLAWAVHP